MGSPTFLPAAAVVVEDDVVGALEGAAGEEGEGQEGVEALEVDAVDGVERAVDLDVDGSGDDDVGHLREDVCDFDGGSGGAHADEVAGGVGANEHVHADAVLAGLEAIELAHQDGGDGEDHDDLDGDGEAADKRAEGTMDEIADNQFIHAVSSVWEWAWRRDGWVLDDTVGRCGCLERSSERSFGEVIWRSQGV